jgi:hypothetical protein
VVVKCMLPLLPRTQAMQPSSQAASTLEEKRSGRWNVGCCLRHQQAEPPESKRRGLGDSWHIMPSDLPFPGSQGLRARFFIPVSVPFPLSSSCAPPMSRPTAALPAKHWPRGFAPRQPLWPRSAEQKTDPTST